MNRREREREKRHNDMKHCGALALAVLQHVAMRTSMPVGMTRVSRTR
jgi:hypothetical protein